MGDRAKLLQLANEAVDHAKAQFLQARHEHLTAKGERDYASETDYAIERSLRQHFEAATPEIGFLGEEDGQTGDLERVWCLDPIDGTVNYVHGSPLCGISLALLEDGQPTVGVIDFPWLGLRYEASDGSGARRNDNAIRVSEVDRLADAVVAIGDYAVGERADEKNAARLDLTERLANHVLRVRMHGSAALDLAWLADGKIDASVCLSNNPWDVAAGIIIAREAGANIYGLNGRPHNLDARATLGSNPQIANDMVRLVNGEATTGTVGN